MAFSNGEVINVEDLGLRPGAAEEAANERDGALAGDAVAPAPGSPAARPAPPLSPEGIPESLPDYLDHVERQAIERALEKTRYNRTAAARLLGISFRALRYRMQRLGIN